MTLIKCRECGKQYSDLAEQCPSCACPTIHQVKEGDKSFKSIIPETDIQPQEDKDKSLKSEVTASTGSIKNALEKKTLDYTSELSSSPNRNKSTEGKDNIFSREVIPRNPAKAWDSCITTIIFICIGWTIPFKVMLQI